MTSKSVGTIIDPKKSLKLIVELVQVVDSMYNFDFQHSACGQRGLCHVSLSSPLSKMCLRRNRVNTMYDAGNVSDKCNPERRDHWS